MVRKSRKFRQSDLYGKKYIYTSYNEDDINDLNELLLSPFNAGVIPSEADFNSILTSTANKASNNFVYFTSRSGLAKGNTKAVPRWVKSSYSKSSLSKALKVSDAVFNSYIADIEKSIALTTLLDNQKAFDCRANLIAQSETARVTNSVSQDLATKNGFNAWIWGSTSSDEPREEHEVLVGELSEIDKTPAPHGEYPGELANCKCQMIFTKVEEALL